MDEGQPTPEERPRSSAATRTLSIPLGPLGATSATLVEPRGKTRALLVLAHGAGGTREQESLVQLQQALAPRGLRSLVFNFPYAEVGRRRPDPMPVLEASYRAVLGSARRRLRRGERLVAGGRSLGGRVASRLASAGESLDALVLLGYPLHPAKDPSRLRVEHLPAIACPALFVSGTRDALATPALLEEHVATVPRARLVWLEGADHGLDFPRRARKDRATVATEVAALLDDWLAAEGVPPRSGRARAAPARGPWPPDLRVRVADPTA